MSQGLDKRITIRLDQETYEWLMKKGGAPFGRLVIEKAKEKIEGRK